MDSLVTELEELRGEKQDMLQMLKDLLDEEPEGKEAEAKLEDKMEAIRKDVARLSKVIKVKTLAFVEHEEEMKRALRALVDQGDRAARPYKRPALINYLKLQASSSRPQNRHPAGAPSWASHRDFRCVKAVSLETARDIQE